QLTCNWAELDVDVYSSHQCHYQKLPLIDDMLRGLQSSGSFMVLMAFVMQRGKAATIPMIAMRISPIAVSCASFSLPCNSNATPNGTPSASASFIILNVCVHYNGVHHLSWCTLCHPRERFCLLTVSIKKNNPSKQHEPKHHHVLTGMTSHILIKILHKYIKSLLILTNVQFVLRIFRLLRTFIFRGPSFFQLIQTLLGQLCQNCNPAKLMLLKLMSIYPPPMHSSLPDPTKLLMTNSFLFQIGTIIYKHISPHSEYARSVGLADTVSARKFLEAAKNSGDSQVFYSTLTFFHLRNARLRGSTAFAKGEHCEVYVEHFKKIFGDIPEYGLEQLI
ncbi:unnamed protein product, partial [Meganyctiphanes norvegica]